MKKNGQKSSKVTKKSLKNKGKVLRDQPMSFEEINKILTNTAIQQQENALRHEKIDRKLEKVAQTIKETARIVKENGIQIKETAQKMKKTDPIIEEIKLLQKETDRIQKENAQQQKETDLQMKKTDKKLNKMVGDLGNQWGVLGENLVSGNLAKRLKEKNIQVERVATNLKDKRGEFDIIAINGKEVVVVEVKCTLDPSDVDKFEKKIINFKDWWPSFAGNKTIYGAMAFLMGENNKAKEKAEKRGFFVISATGDVVIENQDSFQPKVFC